jgi:trans-2,3-dihydro-3-hydroxyanthranilate isomerase
MPQHVYIVDVFAEQPYTGNPLAVIFGGDDLSADTMPKLAAEMSYSETTFVKSMPEPDRGYRMRIFTPAREIAFAGHPNLGMAWVLHHQLAPKDSELIRLNLIVGQVPVTFEPAAAGSDVAWFRAPPVSLGATCRPERIAAALGITLEDIETQPPVQQFSANTSALIVPLRSLDALRRSRLDL